MRRRGPWRVAGLLVPGALAFASAACCGRPPASIVEINLALTRAKEACAAIYAPQELATVENHIEEMNRLAGARKCRKASSAAGPIQPDVVALSSLVESRKNVAWTEAENALAVAEAAMARAAADGGPAASSSLESAGRSIALAKRMSEDPCSYLRAAALAREATATVERARGAPPTGGVEEAPRP